MVSSCFINQLYFIASNATTVAHILKDSDESKRIEQFLKVGKFQIIMCRISPNRQSHSQSMLVR